jgi:large subunit ribosomal protein L18
MDKIKIQNERQARRHGRVRAKISGTNDCPRLSVFRSNRGLFLQLIDDIRGVTLASAKMSEIKGDSGKIDAAKELGLLIASKAKDKKITKIVFDRGFHKYHGRVKAVAEGAREGGLNF